MWNWKATDDHIQAPQQAHLDKALDFGPRYGGDSFGPDHIVPSTTCLITYLLGPRMLGVVTAVTGDLRIRLWPRSHLLNQAFAAAHGPDFELNSTDEKDELFALALPMQQPIDIILRPFQSLVFDLRTLHAGCDAQLTDDGDVELCIRLHRYLFPQGFELPTVNFKGRPFLSTNPLNNLAHHLKSRHFADKFEDASRRYPLRNEGDF